MKKVSCAQAKELDLVDYLASLGYEPAKTRNHDCWYLSPFIGFPNQSGGYELRSEHFKGSSAPKDISFIDNRTEQIAVFECLFNYLSFQVINKNQQAPLTNCLVLNSLSFLEKSRPLMEQYSRVHLMLDRDAASRTQTAKALQWDLDKYIDRSDFY